MSDEDKYKLLRTAEQYNFILHSIDENMKNYEQLEVEGLIKLKQKLNPVPVTLQNGKVICNYTVSIAGPGYNFISKYEELLCCDI